MLKCLVDREIGIIATFMSMRKSWNDGWMSRTEPPQLRDNAIECSAKCRQTVPSSRTKQGFQTVCVEPINSKQLFPARREAWSVIFADFREADENRQYSHLDGDGEK